MPSFMVNSAGDWAQGFMLVRSALYQMTYTPNPEYILMLNYKHLKILNEVCYFYLSFFSFSKY